MSLFKDACDTLVKRWGDPSWVGQGKCVWARKGGEIHLITDIGREFPRAFVVAITPNAEAQWRVREAGSLNRVVRKSLFFLRSNQD